MTGLLAVASAAALVGGISIEATRNYRGAVQAHFVAESAIAQALQIVNGPGVISFEGDVVGPWEAIFGPGDRVFRPLPGFTYTVAAFADAADAESAGSFVATANGPESVRNVVVARVTRSNIPSTAPGAVYLASDVRTNATFNGDTFAVDGSDRNYEGGPGSGAAVPGISTRNDPNTQEVIDSLSAGQRDNVTGLGYSSGPPIVPSAKTSPAAPSVEQLDQMVEDLLRRPGVVTIPENQINGNPPPLGTPEAPQITYFPNSVEIKGNGNVEGAGILLVEGDLTIKGNLSFKGLIIVRGRTQIIGDTEVTGNATLYGSVWTNDLNLVVGGSAIIQYSSQALALANLAGGGGALPTPLRVTSLADCAQVPSGSGGCP